MARKSFVFRPNSAAYTYEFWQRLARADMLVSNYINGGSWTTDEIISMVSGDTGVPKGIIRWMIL